MLSLSYEYSSQKSILFEIFDSFSLNFILCTLAEKKTKSLIQQDQRAKPARYFLLDC